MFLKIEAQARPEIFQGNFPNIFLMFWEAFEAHFLIKIFLIKRKTCIAFFHFCKMFKKNCIDAKIESIVMTSVSIEFVSQF